MRVLTDAIWDVYHSNYTEWLIDEDMMCIKDVADVSWK